MSEQQDRDGKKRVFLHIGDIEAVQKALETIAKEEGGRVITFTNKPMVTVRAVGKISWISLLRAAIANNIGQILYYIGRKSRAAKLYQKAIRLVPQLDMPWVNMSQYYLDPSEQKFALALVYADVAINLNPRNDIAWANKGAALVGLKRHEEALEACQKAIELNKKNIFGWHYKGAALMYMNKFAEAIVCFRRALQLHPNSLQRKVISECLKFCENSKKEM